MHRRFRSAKVKKRLFICLAVVMLLWLSVLILSQVLEWSISEEAKQKFVNFRISTAKTHKRQIKEKYEDLHALLTAERNERNPQLFESVIIREKEDPYDPSLAEALNLTYTSNMTSMDKFQYRMSRQHVYQENDQIVEKLLHEMATMPTIDAVEKEGGTEIKLIIAFPGDMFSLFKPMRYPREQQTLPNHFQFSDYERHNAEIAAYHVDKVLGFRHVVPVIGRLMNITEDIRPHVDGDFEDTFFTSPAKNLCFYGTCKVYCDVHHAICGSPDLLEGSLAAFLPEFNGSSRLHNLHPWKRSYSPWSRAEWEGRNEHCDEVKTDPLYFGRRILDIMDMAVFDFLIGNADRHHYNTWKIFGTETAPILYDHGRSFGKPFFDDLIIIAPVRQCCMIREKTLKTLLRFHTGPQPLSHFVRESMAKDPLTPILWEPHFEALDRRVELILRDIRRCVSKKKFIKTMLDKSSH